ncbi:amino acid ABC transporter substrate-binding protein, PAAT family [Georgenia satyanarayanai]|uniref:Amino acid ABC transporter substrate-binding protein, PAAT family n=2 Tax=Georgenia satyanarayanai TaxID=860221 RepID=A0A2Y8ZXQ3_9MICO|nr:amino acid ABC transporter substrate-binding protein (PAAT family) [Georgenia satyanarayanai]SSA37101.1 amino acid ABC transporter substrate-binding protein, PAAT family [Georgenia satyanarayanai]
MNHSLVQTEGTMMTTTSTRRRVAIPAAAAALALGLAACSDDSGGDDGAAEPSEGQSKLEALQEAGTITVGFAGEAPYSFENDEGELVGASVALQERIWGELGIENVEGVQAEFGQLIQGLNAGRWDVVAAGMSILPERCEQAIFSEPEFQYTTALLVPEGNPDNLSDMQSIAEAQDVQMAAMTGAIEATYAADLGIDAIEVGNPQDGMDAVTGGRADVFALTGISLNWMVDNAGEDPGVEVTDTFVATIDGVEQLGAGGTVFRTEDTELRDAYNEQLAPIVDDEDEYLSVVGDWGFTAGERPAGDFTLTTEDLCAGELG